MWTSLPEVYFRIATFVFKIYLNILLKQKEENPKILLCIASEIYVKDGIKKLRIGLVNPHRYINFKRSHLFVTKMTKTLISIALKGTDHWHGVKNSKNLSKENHIITRMVMGCTLPSKSNLLFFS